MKKTTLTPFEQALLDVNLEEFTDIPTEQDIDMEFSPAFQANVQELIRKSERNHWSSGKVFLRKVALVALISAMLLLTACSIPAVREAIIEFFFKDVGTHYEFTYDPEDVVNAPDGIETVYFPTYIPDGYEELLIDYSVAAGCAFWITPEGNTLNYIQGTLPENPLSGEHGNINSEGANTEWITINGCHVLRVEDEEFITYCWASSEYEFTLACQKPIEDEEIEKIFDSIRVNDAIVIVGAE